MKMSKKTFAVAVSLFVLLLFAGTGLVQAETTINFLGMKQAGLSTEEMDAIAREYEAMNPGIKIVTTYMEYDALHDKQVTALAAKSSSLDAVIVDGVWVPEFVEAGWLVDVTGKISSEMKKDIIPAAMGTVTYKNRVWGTPWMADTKFLFYNKEILKKAGFNSAPKTWEELVMQSKKIKSKGLVEYPIMWAWAQDETSICDFAVILNGFGGKFVDKDFNPAFNDKNGVEALTWMVDTMKSGLSNPSSTVSHEEEVRHTFSQGKAAFALNWPYMYQMANSDPKESSIVGKVEMALIPAAKGKGIRSVTVDGSMAYSVSAFSKNKDATWKYLKYFAGKKVQKKYSDKMPSVWNSVLSDPAVIAAQPVFIPMFQKQYPYAKIRPPVSYYPEFSKILQVAIQNALIGKQSPQKALDDAAKEIRNIQ